MPPCDQTGIPHFHSSTISGSASWMSLRTFASIIPRQSPSSRILSSINAEADSAGADFFMGSSNVRSDLAAPRISQSRPRAPGTSTAAGAVTGAPSSGRANRCLRGGAVRRCGGPGAGAGQLEGPAQACRIGRLDDVQVEPGARGLLPVLRLAQAGQRDEANRLSEPLADPATRLVAIDAGHPDV